MTWRRYSFRSSVAVVVLLAAVTFAGAAAAQDPDDAAVDEYAEIVPTGEGGRDPKSTDETTQTLSPSVSAEVESEAGTAAPVLKRLATSPRYGAPQRELRAVGRAEEAGSETAVAPASPVFAAVNAIATEGSAGRLGALLVVMLVIGVSAVVVAARRHRAGRASPGHGSGSSA